MDRQYEIQKLWGLSITHKNGWQQENCPVVRGDYGDLERAWNKATKAMSGHQRDALMKTIENAIQKQTAFRGQQRAAKEFVPQPILISAFINKKRFKNDVVLQNEKEPEKKTGLCKCGKGIDINFNLNGEPTGACWTCYDKLSKGNARYFG